MSDSERLSNVLSSPIEGLICIERAKKKEDNVPDTEEKQRNYWIQTLISDISTISGELFGKNGNGGFVGETKASFIRMDTKMDRVVEEISCLKSEMAQHKVATEDQLIATNNKSDQAHFRLDALEPRVKTLEEV